MLFCSGLGVKWWTITYLANSYLYRSSCPLQSLPQCTSGYSLCSVFSTRMQTTFCGCDQFCLCFGFKQPTKAWYSINIYIFLQCFWKGFFFSVSGKKMDHSPVIPPQNLCCYKLGHKKTRNTAIGPHPGPAQPSLALWGNRSGLQLIPHKQLTYTILVSAGPRTAKGSRRGECDVSSTMSVLLCQVFSSVFFLSNIFGLQMLSFLQKQSTKANKKYNCAPPRAHSTSLS